MDLAALPLMQVCASGSVSPGSKKLPAMELGRVGKREKHDLMAQRALAELEPWLDATGARLVRAQVEGALA